MNTLIRMSASELAASLSNAGHRYAMSHSASTLSPASRLNEQFSGMTQVSVVLSQFFIWAFQSCCSQGFWINGTSEDFNVIYLFSTDYVTMKGSRIITNLMRTVFFYEIFLCIKTRHNFRENQSNKTNTHVKLLFNYLF